MQKVVQGVLRGGARWLPPALLARVIEQPMNHILRAERQRGAFAFLGDQWVHIEVSDYPLTLYVRCNAQRCLQVSLAPQTAVVRMRSDSLSMLQLILQQVDPDTLFFRRKLLITGDTEIGLQLKNLLDTVCLAERVPAPLLAWLQRTSQAPIP